MLWSTRGRSRAITDTDCRCLALCRASLVSVWDARRQCQLRAFNPHKRKYVGGAMAVSTVRCTGASVCFHAVTLATYIRQGKSEALLFLASVAVPNAVQVRQWCSAAR